MTACTHRWRIDEFPNPVTHRWESQCGSCGLTRAFGGGDPDNPFTGGSQWGRKKGELASGHQAARRELVLNAEHSGAFGARERK